MIRLISREESTTALGSDPAERQHGAEAIAAMLRADAEGREGEPERATIEHVVAYREGDVAWSVAEIAFHRRADKVPFRTTTVLRREQGEWKIVQWVVSVLVRNDAIGMAWPAAESPTGASDTRS